MPCVDIKRDRLPWLRSEQTAAYLSEDGQLVQNGLLPSNHIRRCFGELFTSVLK